jgi:penicillin-binding protein 2
VKLKNNSFFVCFAPRENPRIVVAVAVENGGYGGTQAAPIASLLVEKYLNDTLRTERIQEVNRIAGLNLMPGYLVRLQFKDDSVRAANWAKQSKDSSRWLKFQTPSFRAMMLDTSENSSSPLYRNIKKMQVIKLPWLEKPKAPPAALQKPDSTRVKDSTRTTGVQKSPARKKDSTATDSPKPASPAHTDIPPKKDSTPI